MKKPLARKRKPQRVAPRKRPAVPATDLTGPAILPVNDLEPPEQEFEPEPEEEDADGDYER